LIIAAAAKLILTAAEEANLYFDERKANSSKYQQIIYDRSPAQQENNALAAWAGVASDIAQDITSGEICRGRVVVVKNGELVPVDGIILASSEPLTTPILFNEAGLTGESAPAAKFPLNIGVDYSQCPEIKDFASVARCVRHRLTTLDPVIQADEPTTSNVQFAGTIIRPRKLPEREADIVVANFDFKNAAYRGSTLHGTEWVLLLAVYTGPATKERLVTIKSTQF
jgi:magnesium-transporting ATPase (P-type)